MPELSEDAFKELLALYVRAHRTPGVFTEKSGLRQENVHVLQHLERFLSSFLSSKEFYAAFIGAVIGGLLTGRYALRAQKQASAPADANTFTLS